jgi:hypothetical protein
MDLYSAGINHNDPLMRKELVDWLQELRHQHDSDPCFIAVEWGKNAHAKVAGSRDEFKQLAKKQWPGVSEDLVTVLADAMGYEGDAHRTLWPDLEPVWLDDDRPSTLKIEYELDNYAAGRLGVYKFRMGKADPVSDPQGALQQLSDAAHVGQQSWADNPRDESWAKQIKAAIGNNPECEWSVVICGSEHFAKHAGNARDLLDKNSTCQDLPSPGRLVRRVLTL